MIIIAWLLFWSKKSELFCHHWLSRWNFAWLSQPTCTPTSLIAPIWLPLLRNLIRFGTFDHFFPFLEYSIAFSWSERSVLEYDSAGYVCPDVRHRLPDPRLLLCPLARLPQHCWQGEAVPREIWAILNYNYHTKVVQIWSRTTTTEWQTNILCNKCEITSIIYPCLSINPIMEINMK